MSELPATTPIKLLWIRPINNTTFDQAFADMIRSVKLPNAEVDVVSLRLPPPVRLPSLEWRVFEAEIWKPVVEMAYYAGRNGYDGCAIPCFYDTALDEAREVSGDAIVSAPCEAALKAVSGLCNRFSVIVGQDKWKVQMEDRIRHYGYHDRLVSFSAIGMHVQQLQDDKAKTETAIRKAVEKVLNDGAEAVILGCTIEFGFYQVLQREFGVPIIDVALACYQNMERMAMNKVQFGWKPSRILSMGPPSEDVLKSSGVFAAPPPIGNLINISRT